MKASKFQDSPPNQAHTHFETPRATFGQMKRVSLNANQTRSFDEQLAQGTSRTPGMRHVLSLCLSAFHAAFTGVKVPVVEGMSEQAVKMKVSNESRRHGIHSGAPFPKAVQNDCPSTKDLLPLQCENILVPVQQILTADSTTYHRQKKKQ